MIITFSVVAYYSGDVLIGCLDSIIKKSQLHSDEFEIIVVDNSNGFSTDKCIVEQFSNEYNGYSIDIIFSDNNGYGSGNNIALQCAKGKIFCVMNPDTRIFQPIDSRIIDSFRYSDDLIAVGSKQISIVNNSFFFRPEYSYPLLKSLLNNAFKKLNYFNCKYMALSGALTFYDKNNFISIGGFDEKYFLYCEESDISRRALKLNYRLKYIPQYCYVHLDGERDVVSDSSLERTLASVKIYFNKFGGSFWLYKMNLSLIIYVKLTLSLFSTRFDVSALKKQLSIIRSS